MKVCSECQRCYDDPVVYCTEQDHPLLSEIRDGSTEIIAGYQLESLLGPSGQVETYRARHKTSGQSCLIKILPPDENCSEQFLRESKIAAALYNPNVADIYDAGILASGDFFVVGEEPAGHTLREVLDNVGVPDLLTSIMVVRHAAEALHSLHQNNLTHRAVSPENIILTAGAENGTLARIRNPDLGGVRERSILSNKFLIGPALNALKYFAPEQCDGEASGVQTDVYGLGVVFYEMLTGAAPFNASTAMGLISKHRNQLPPNIRIDNFNLRMLVTHALTESLQKLPRLRQSSANVFARQLRHIEQLATHISTPPPAVVFTRSPETPRVAALAKPVESEIGDRVLVRDGTQQSESSTNIGPIEIETLRPGTVRCEIENFASEVLAVEENVAAPAMSEPKAIASEVRKYDVPATNEERAIRLQEQLIELVEARVEQPHPLQYFLLDEDFDQDEDLSSDESLWSAAIAAPANFTTPKPDAVKETPAKSYREFVERVVGISDNVLAAPKVREAAVTDRSEQACSAEPNVEKELSIVEPVDIEPARIESERVAFASVEPEPRKLAATAGSKITKISWELPEDDIPSVADVIEVLSLDQATDTQDSRVVPEAEYTLRVRSKPFKSESTKPGILDNGSSALVLPRKSPRKADFCPSILEVNDSPKSISSGRVGRLFAGSRYSSHYRAIVIGGAALIVLVALFFVGDAVISGRVQSHNPETRIAASTTSHQKAPAVQVHAEVQVPQPQVEQKTAESPTVQSEPQEIEANPDRENRPDVPQPKAEPINKETSSSAAKPEAPAAKANVPARTAKTESAGRLVVRMAQAPTTLVISSKDGKLTSSFEPAARTLGSTRTRIVGTPPH